MYIHGATTTGYTVSILDVSPCSLENFLLLDTLSFRGGTVEGQMKWPSQVAGFRLYYTGKNFKEVLSDLPDGLEDINYDCESSFSDEAYKMLKSLPNPQSLKICHRDVKIPKRQIRFNRWRKMFFFQKLCPIYKGFDRQSDSIPGP